LTRPHPAQKRSSRLRVPEPLVTVGLGALPLGCVTLKGQPQRLAKRFLHAVWPAEPDDSSFWRALRVATGNTWLPGRTGVGGADDHDLDETYRRAGGALTTNSADVGVESLPFRHRTARRQAPVANAAAGFLLDKDVTTAGRHSGARPSFLTKVTVSPPAMTEFHPSSQPGFTSAMSGKPSMASVSPTANESSPHRCRAAVTRFPERASSDSCTSPQRCGSLFYDGGAVRLAFLEPIARCSSRSRGVPDVTAFQDPGFPSRPEGLFEPERSRSGHRQVSLAMTLARPALLPGPTQRDHYFSAARSSGRHLEAIETADGAAVHGPRGGPQSAGGLCVPPKGLPRFPKPFGRGNAKAKLQASLAETSSSTPPHRVRAAASDSSSRGCCVPRTAWRLRRRRSGHPRHSPGR